MGSITMSWTILTSPISSITTLGFGGDAVALPREDRVYLKGNLTGQTPKKRRVTRLRSDLKDLHVACSFPVGSEQHELDPDGNGADEMVTDEIPLDNENGGDSEATVRKPLSSSQSEYP